MLAIFPISTGYKIFGLLHIISALAAFGPLMMYPSLRRAGATERLAQLHMRMTFPALTATWGFGMGLVGMSKNTFEMSQTWVVVSLLCWVIAMAVSWFLIRPAITETGDDADKKFAAGIGITNLIMVVVLIMMIFKPCSGI